MRFLIILLALSPFAVMAQVSYLISSGISITNVNPTERYDELVSSRAQRIMGSDWQISAMWAVKPTSLFEFRLLYNQHVGNVYYNYQSAVNSRYIIDGEVYGKYAGLMMGVQFNTGEKLKLYYGGGVYMTARMSGKFSGVEKTELNGQVETINITNDHLDFYRNTSLGIYPSAGLGYLFSQKIELILRADFIYFIQPKNVIFAETGTVNELNFSLALKYNIIKNETSL